MVQFFDGLAIVWNLLTKEDQVTLSAIIAGEESK